MQDMPNEPIRYNEGKVDWTYLPWDNRMLDRLCDHLVYYNKSDPDYLQKCLLSRLIDRDVEHILALSLLISEGTIAPIGSLHWDLPYKALEDVCRVLAFGAEKYARDNFKIAPGLPLESYIQSMWRHLVSYLRGEELDTDSGLPNLSHLACNAFMYLWTKKEYHNEKA